MSFDLAFTIHNFYQTLTGIPITLLITFVAVAAGFPVAFFIACGRIKKVPVLNGILTLYISFLRGTPVVVQIFLVYNGVPVLIKMLAKSFNVNIDIYSINPLIYAFMVYGLNASAGFSELWKSALSSVPEGQLEAALTSGLTSFNAYTRIIIPQAIATAAPSLCSTSLNILKNTSLVFIMTVMDITARGKIAAGQQYKYVEGYLDILITYIIVCSILEFCFKLAEKRLTRYKRESFIQPEKTNVRVGHDRDKKCA